MASFFTSLLVAYILVALTDSAAPSSGGNKLVEPTTNHSVQNRSSDVNGGPPPKRNQATRPRKPAPLSAQPGDSKLSRSEIIELRLEMIKEKILKKLHMDHEPNYTARPQVSLPEPLANFDIEDEYHAERPQRKKTQVIVMTEQVSKKVPGADEKGVQQKLSLKFRLTGRIYTNSIASAFLWIRKRQNSNLDERNIRISLGDSAKKNKRQAIQTEVRTKGSWLIISVKKVVKDWTEEDRSENAPDSATFVHSLEVSCTNCHANTLVATKGKYQPFLVIDIHTVSVDGSPRKKRSINCRHDTTNCCLERLYVSFQKLNWSNWIIQPKGFYANYCKGSCDGAFASEFHHTFIMRKLSLRDKMEYKSCCVPTNMSNLSILYLSGGELGSTNTMLKKDIQDMIVERCGCV